VFILTSFSYNFSISLPQILFLLFLFFSSCSNCYFKKQKKTKISRKIKKIRSVLWVNEFLFIWVLLRFINLYLFLYCVIAQRVEYKKNPSIFLCVIFQNQKLMCGDKKTMIHWAFINRMTMSASIFIFFQKKFLLRFLIETDNFLWIFVILNLKLREIPSVMLIWNITFLSDTN
jgi:hypothetical protein